MCFPKALELWLRLKSNIFSSLLFFFSFFFAAQHRVHDAELQEGLKQAEPGEFAASDTRLTALSYFTVYYN